MKTVINENVTMKQIMLKTTSMLSLISSFLLVLIHALGAYKI